MYPRSSFPAPTPGCLPYPHRRQKKGEKQALLSRFSSGRADLQFRFSLIDPFLRKLKAFQFCVALCGKGTKSTPPRSMPLPARKTLGAKEPR
jgi:hypothetical protein